MTKDQLKALLEYYDMYGVEEMDFSLEHFQETLLNFAPRLIKLDIPEPSGRCCFVGTPHSGKKTDEKP